MVINHLLNGMILQVEGPLTHFTPRKFNMEHFKTQWKLECFSKMRFSQFILGGSI